MKLNVTHSVRLVGAVAAVLTALFGAGLILVAGTLGHCSAFGGRCPADPPPWWEDDVLGMSALGGALVVGPLLALRRGRWRWWVAAGGAIGAAVVVGFLVRSIAHG